tara:strand:+ start:1181 stop:1954 length:774 start_codon:yes stop_codon:yes gene_type:complete
MRKLRVLVGSWAYNCVFIGWTAFAVILMMVLQPFPRKFSQCAVKAWAWTQHWALKVLVGLDFEIRGAENIIHGSAIYACKHQSAWETYFFYLLFSDPAYVLKRELMQIPIWGQVAKKCGAVSVDREGGASALKTLVRDVKDRLSQKRPVIVFPEGTRTHPGEKIPYHVGIAALYTQCDVPLIPVALNSGLFWGRRSFTKHAGCITIEFQPMISSGLKRAAFIEKLERTVENASNKLAQEGMTRFPHTKSVSTKGRSG